LAPSELHVGGPKRTRNRFAPRETIDLNKAVISTEAHPLQREKT
jgi:hypothetical protein